MPSSFSSTVLIIRRTRVVNLFIKELFFILGLLLLLQLLTAAAASNDADKKNLPCSSLTNFVLTFTTTFYFILQKNMPWKRVGNYNKERKKEREREARPTTLHTRSVMLFRKKKKILRIFFVVAAAPAVAASIANSSTIK